ncbi:MAG TPA: hypothetical protein VNV16_10155 [Methylibium sp.]|nr:hypothetical protein [Methylibium sp.]
MSVPVTFVISESLKSVAQAVGITATPTGEELPPCPLHVGDIISQREAPGLFFRVTGRVFFLGAGEPPSWQVTLEQASDPFAALD